MCIGVFLFFKQFFYNLIFNFDVLILFDVNILGIKQFNEKNTYKFLKLKLKLNPKKTLNVSFFI